MGLFDEEPQAPSCRAIYPDDHAPWFAEQTRVRRPPGAQVLHVGDSLVEGQGSPRAFTDELTDLSGDTVKHLNAGVIGTGPDYYLLAIRQWVERVRVDAVVLYYYLGNDFEDIDRAYYCCRYGRLFDYGGGRPVARCPEPDTTRSLVRAVATSPAPYPVRVATAFSWIARHAVSAQATLPARLGLASPGVTDPGRRGDEKRAHLRMILEAAHSELAARGIPFVTVILPFVADLIAPDPAKTRTAALREDFLRLTRELGIPTLDAWPVVVEAMARYGQRGIFVEWVGGRPDSHYNALGHRVLAGWLAGALEPLGVPTRRPLRRP